MLTNLQFTLVFLCLAVTIYNVRAARYEAQEAHRHTHEIACYVGAESLCSYHKDQPHD